MDTVHLPLAKAPKNVLGAVAGDAEVEGMKIPVAFGPDLLAYALPEIGDGVAIKNELDIPGDLMRSGIGGHDALDPVLPWQGVGRGVRSRRDHREGEALGSGCILGKGGSRDQQGCDDDLEFHCKVRNSFSNKNGGAGDHAWLPYCFSTHSR